MIKEHNGNVIKCHKCKTYLSFDNEDVTEVEREKFGNKYWIHYLENNIKEWRNFIC